MLVSKCTTTLWGTYYRNKKRTYEMQEKTVAKFERRLSTEVR